MSPVKDLSDITRLPRLGKIRLGIKVEVPGKPPYPKAMDHFVVPPEVAAVYSETPTELLMMFPVDDPAVFAPQWLRRYSTTQGLVCKGDGVTAGCKIDTATGAMACHTTTEWVMKYDLPCNPQECPEYLAKRCKKVLNLQFMLPDVPGIGVYQVDTTARNSIININSMIFLLQGLVGRCSMIPLKLRLVEETVTPQGQKTKPAWILHVAKDDLKLSDLARMALLPPSRVLIPEPAEIDVEEFYPEGASEEEPPPAKGKTEEAPTDGLKRRKAKEVTPGVKWENMPPEAKVWLEEHFGTSDASKLTPEQVNECVEALTKIKADQEAKAQEYRDPQRRSAITESGQTEGQAEPNGPGPQPAAAPALTEAQMKELRQHLVKLIKEDSGMDVEQGKQFLRDHCNGKAKVMELTPEELEHVIKLLEHLLKLARTPAPAQQPDPEDL